MPTAGLSGPETIRIRIISDVFPVLSEKQKAGSSWGRYGCSEKGMILVTGSRTQLDSACSGTLIELSQPVNEQQDLKTGALIIPYSSAILKS